MHEEKFFLYNKTQCAFSPQEHKQGCPRQDQRPQTAVESFRIDPFHFHDSENSTVRPRPTQPNPTHRSTLNLPRSTTMRYQQSNNDTPRARWHVHVLRPPDANCYPLLLYVCSSAR
ncbi:unnamed protein product, partial [Ectocarpus fasciculatus]